MLVLGSVSTWNSKQPVLYGCFNWMIQNLYTGNGCFTKHPLKTGCLEFQAYILYYIYYVYVYIIHYIHVFDISYNIDTEYPGNFHKFQVMDCSLFPCLSSSFFPAKTQVLKAQLDLAKEFQRPQCAFWLNEGVG